MSGCKIHRSRSNNRADSLRRAREHRSRRNIVKRVTRYDIISHNRLFRLVVWECRRLACNRHRNRTRRDRHRHFGVDNLEVLRLDLHVNRVCADIGKCRHLGGIRAFIARDKRIGNLARIKIKPRSGKLRRNAMRLAVIDTRIRGACHIDGQCSGRHFKPTELRYNRIVVLKRTVSEFVAEAVLYLSDTRLGAVADRVNAFAVRKIQRPFLDAHLIDPEGRTVEHLLRTRRKKRHLARRNDNRRLADVIVVIFRRDAIADRMSPRVLHRDRHRIGPPRSRRRFGVSDRHRRCQKRRCRNGDCMPLAIIDRLRREG